MVNWYYVDGTERVGPITLDNLKSLFQSHKINEETYLWRKGFANWERLKNIQELNLVDTDSNNLQDTVSSLPAFSWTEINSNDEIFFIKTGTDRHQNESHVYGPYSLNEIEDAYTAKRINNKTLIFTCGLENWINVGSVPVLAEKFGFDSLEIPLNVVHPVIFATENEIFLLKSIDNQNIKVLSNYIVDGTSELNVSMFSGVKLIKQNLTLRLGQNNYQERLIDAEILGLDEATKKLINKNG